MATIFRARRNTNPGSGGKILRGRRVATVASPYARPISPPSSTSPPPESPNWLFGVVLPATRKIVNGAGKLVSTVFGNDSVSESESDYASSSDDDGSEDNDDAEVSDSLEQDETPLANNYLEAEPQAIVQRSEARHEIERLLMQETFSREECIRLTEIIQSRVVESHTSVEGGAVGQNELPDRTIASSIATPGAPQSDRQTRKSYSYLDSGFLSPSSRSLPYLHTAIMEAQKWSEEKKSESCSKADYGLSSSPYMLPNVTEGHVGSPVVLAKAYMQARPPWASPSSSHIGFRSPSPIAMHLVKEETPYTIGADSLSSSKFKRSSVADDPWSIVLSEARRVRFKSEEDSLRPNSSTHIESSALELEHKDRHTSSRDGKPDGEPGAIHDLPPTTSLDSSTDFPAKITINAGFNVNGELVNEIPSSIPATTISNKNKDSEDPRLTEGEGCTTLVANEPLLPDPVPLHEDGTLDQSAETVKSDQNVSKRDDIMPALQSKVDPTGVGNSQECILEETVQVNNFSQLNHASGQNEMEFVNDSRLPGGNHPSQNEVNGSRERVAANGCPPSESSLSAGLNVQSGTGPQHEVSSESKLETGIPMEEETCELLSEASVEIPTNDEETDGVASESQTSSSRYSTELSLAEIQRSVKKLSTSRRAEKLQLGTKMGKSIRRGKGRAKQNKEQQPM